MDKVTREIVRKIQKMLRLAEKAGTEEEARTAMKMAHEMLRRYNLSLGEVNSFIEQQCNEEVFSFKGQSIPSYLKLLSNAMALLFNCKTIWIRDNRKKEISANFVGFGADPVVACQTYQFLMQFARRKARERKLKGGKKSDYLFGSAHSILERAFVMHKNAEPAENALVSVRNKAIWEYMERKYPGAKAMRSVNKRYLSDGLLAGLADGKNASLDRPVENGASMQAIGA